MDKRLMVFLGSFASTLVVIGVSAACTAAPAAAPAGISKDEAEAIANSIVEKKLNEADNKLALWSLQAGTGPRMADLARHFNMLWYAAQAGNWAMADFEVSDQVDGTIKKMKLRNSGIAKDLDAWTKERIQPLAAAVKSQDTASFNRAYDQAIEGCNSCHADKKAGDISMKAIKVIRPTAPILPNLDYKGQ
ncbi:MAG: hypothetical protein HY690_14705 [Chloroflexi bacterium]|nr:hypothetical protein [Chloroflexota bacterium]